MYAIVSYDVSAKRVGKALKICRKYLKHVHKSLFEGQITGAKLEKMKRELATVLVPDEDSVRIYRLDSPRYLLLDEIGVTTDRSVVI